MAKKPPRPRKRRPTRAWWQRPAVATGVQTGVIVVGVGAFLAATVNSFDADEIKELAAVATAAATVIRFWHTKA
jgi:hypothetical protein